MKDVADLVKKFNDIDLNRRILSLEGEVMDLSRENRRAEERVEELERTLKFKGQLKFDEPYYWLEGDTVPFCPKCWEKEHEAIHVVVMWNDGDGIKRDCPNCKTGYVVRGHRGRHQIMS